MLHAKPVKATMTNRRRKKRKRSKRSVMAQRQMAVRVWETVPTGRVT